MKQAAAEGTECSDGQQPAKVSRGRKPGAKSKAKAKAKAKTQPKPTEKVKGKGKGKVTRKSTSELEEVEVANPASASNPPAAPKPKRKTKPSTKTMPGESASKKPKVRGEEPSSPPPVPTAGAQCFARRKRPTSKFGGVKWDAIRQAFQQKVKPLLKSYSAFEDHG